MQAKFLIAMAHVALLTLFSSVAVAQNGFLVDGAHQTRDGRSPAPVVSGSNSLVTLSESGKASFEFLTAQASSPIQTVSLSDHTQRPKLKGDDSYKGGKCSDGTCDATYHIRAYGEYLYLRARDVEVPYAVESNLTINPAIQTSPIALVDQDYSSGFRVGFALVLDDRTELAATYAWFESGADHHIILDSNRPNHNILPMVSHPSTPTSITSTVEASAVADIDFDLIDLDLRRVLAQSCQADLFGTVGVRYGRLEQGFEAQFFDGPTAAPLDARVMTDIDFEGIGLKLGLDGDYYATRLPLMGYMKGAVSLLAGEFNASYQQFAVGAPDPEVNTAWSAGRIVPTFDLEIGGGFYSPNGHLRATVGYCYSVWTNMVKTDDWIHGVQGNMFRNMDDAITFDGLVLRVEGRF